MCVLWLVTSVDSILPQHSSIGGVGKGNFYQRGAPIYKERADCLVRTDRTATHLYYHRLEAGLLPERGDLKATNNKVKYWIGDPIMKLHFNLCKFGSLPATRNERSSMPFESDRLHNQDGPKDHQTKKEGSY